MTKLLLKHLLCDIRKPNFIWEKPSVRHLKPCNSSHSLFRASRRTMQQCLDIGGMSWKNKWPPYTQFLQSTIWVTPLHLLPIISMLDSESPLDARKHGNASASSHNSTHHQPLGAPSTHHPASVPGAMPQRAQ